MVRNRTETHIRQIAAATLLFALALAARWAAAQTGTAPAAAQFASSTPAQAAPASGAQATPGLSVREQLQQKMRTQAAPAAKATPTPAPRPTATATAAATATPTPTPAAPAADGTIRLTGQFNWVGEKGQPMHPLTATLTPSGTGRWDIVWNFSWGNQPLTYRGTVQGNIQTGAVSGTGNAPTGGRTFAFRGTAQGGSWTFSTNETTGGKIVNTGTATAKVGG